MNSLAKEFDGKGLVVVGVTSDMDAEKTDAWVGETGARYPYGYDVDAKLERRLGILGPPHAVLVSAGGKILYSGHPAGLEHTLVEQATKDSLATPLWKNEKAKAVLAGLRANKFGDAWAAAAKLGEDQEGPKILGYVKRRVESIVYEILQAHKSGDFLAAQTQADAAAESLVGTPDIEVVHTILKDLAQDEFAQGVMVGQKKLAELVEKRQKVRSKAAATELLAEFETLIAAYPDTIVSKKGNVVADSLAKKLKVKRGA